MNVKKTIQNQKNPEKGFSLIEVLIAVFILGIVSMTLISVFIYGFNVVYRTKQVSLATQIAQEEVELVRNLGYDDILLLGSTYNHDSLSELVNGAGAISVEDGPGDDIKKLTVSVTWDYRGSNLRKDVVTFITREGVNKK
ncbi:prepilin-type N-terminal cleavage/methylation domain-containing protein [Acidobacteriota bacterium]